MFFRLFLLLSFFLFVAPAYAEPFSTIAAIGSAISTILSTPILGFIVKTVIGLGISLLEQALTKQNNKPKPAGSVLDIKMGDDQPMTFPVGSRAVAGRRKYIGTWGSADGTPNAYLVDVIEISSLPSYAGPFGLTSLWIDQQKCGVLWDQPDPDGRGYPIQQYLHPNGTPYGWIKYYDGTQTAADPYLVAKFGSHPDRPYTADRVGYGLQYVVLTWRIDTDLNLGGSPPEGLFEPHPTPFYDPRKDSTNGGNGGHRYGDWSTYEPTLNPMVIAYNICRGIYYTPDEWVFGGQNVAAHRLPISAWFAAMNECDRNVNGAAQFRCGFEISCDQKATDVIEDLRVACAGRLAEVGGMIKPLVGAPGAAVYSFTDETIVVTSEQDFDPFPSLTQTYNRIAGTYPEPDQRWAMTDAPEQRNLDQEAADGNRSLAASVSFDAVPYSAQVQQLMNTMAIEQRRFRTHTFYLPPEAWAMEPNDVVSWTSARNDYSEKKFLVSTANGGAGLLQKFSLKEIDPTDYDPPTIIVAPPTGWIGPITAPSQPMTGWNVEPATVKDPGGIDRRPAIKISSAQNLDDVRAVWVQVRLKATGDLVFDSDSNPYAAPNTGSSYSWLISGDWMLSNTDYEARGRYLPYSNRPTDWSGWLPVTTPNILIQSGDVLDGAIIASKIADAAVTAEKIMDEAVTNLKLADAAVSTAKMQVAAVTADVLASGAVISTKLADGAVTAAKLASAAIDATKLASSIKAVEVVSTLPTTDNVEGRQVYLTTDGKLYRYHNGAWTAAVPSTDITGQFVSSQIANAAITNQQLAALAVDASKLADNAITTTKIADNAISTPKIQANAVVAANIAANAITARSLVLQDWENLIPDNQMQSSDSWFSRPANSVVNPVATQAFNSKGSLDYTYVAGAGYQLIVQSDAFPIVPGQQYLASCQAIRTSGTKMAVWARVHWTDATGQVLNPDVYPPIFDTSVGTTVSGLQTYTVTMTPPANAFGAIFRIYVQRDNTDGNISFGGVSFLRKATANLLVDGSVVAGKIAANAVTAGTIAANAVTAGTIAAGAVSASQIAADAVTADKIASNAVTTDALAVGSGKNLLQNAGFTMGTDCWVTFHSGTIPNQTFRIRGVTETWAGPNCPTLMLWQNGPNTGNNYYNDIRWVRPDAPTLPNELSFGVPCAPGDWFEVSAYVSAHRCLAELRLEWLGSDGAAVGYTTANQNNAVAGSSTNPDLWPRLRCVGAAPANAVAVAIHIRKWETNTGQADSYMFLNKPMLCRCPPNAAEFTPWSDGGVVMITNGGIVADAVTADKIATNAVTADAIAANAVTAGKIAAGAVTATTIAAGTITGDKLAANTIGASQIAADAITAKQLVLTDFSNMADNGWQAGSLGGWVTQNVQNFYNDTGASDSAGFVLQTLGRDCAISNYVAVTAGEVYAFDVWVYNTDPNRANILAATMTPSGSVSYPGVVGTDVKNSWTRLQGKYTVPSGVTKLAMDLQVNKTAGAGSSCYWSKPVMRRAVSAELIVDGAVTANKISVNSLDALTANLGAVNISSAVIGSLQVGTSNISGGAVTGVGVGRVAGTQTIGANGTVNLVSCVVNVAGDGRVVIDAMTIGQFNQNGGSQNSQPIGCNIFRDGTAIFSQTYYLGVVQTVVNSTGGSNGGTTQATYTAGMVAVSGLYDAPGAGNHTYILQIFCPGNTIGWNESNITATALKR